MIKTYWDRMSLLFERVLLCLQNPFCKWQDIASEGEAYEMTVSRKTKFSHWHRMGIYYYKFMSTCTYTHTYTHVTCYPKSEFQNLLRLSWNQPAARSCLDVGKRSSTVLWPGTLVVPRPLGAHFFLWGPHHTRDVGKWGYRILPKLDGFPMDLVQPYSFTIQQMDA